MADLQSKTIQDIFSKSMSWLESQTEKINKNRNPTDSEILQLALGYQICQSYLGKKPNNINRTMQSFVSEIDKKETEIDSSTCDPLLALLVNSVLKGQNLTSLRLNNFTQAVSKVMQGDTLNQAQGNADLFQTLFLLNKMGSIKSTPQQITLKDRPTDFWVKADEPIMRSIGAEVAGATVFGSMNPSCSEITLKTLQTAFSAWALHTLYELNLNLGTFLARTLNYLGSDEQTINELYQFLLFQQQPDGRFGYLANEAYKMRTLGHAFSEEFELYLPVTVSCLWTLAELGDKKIRIFHL